MLATAQPPAKIAFDAPSLKTVAIKNFANAQYLECLLNLQRVSAMGDNDGLVTGLMTMAYDSLVNFQAAEQAREFAKKSFRIDSNIIRRIALTSDNPQIVQRKLVSAGASAYNSAHYDSSEMYFTEYLKQVPNDTFAIYFLANCQFHQKKFDDALNTYKRILDIDNNKPEVHNLVGLCYMLKNNYLSARDHFAQSALMDNSNYNTFFNLGKVHYGLQDISAALQNLEQSFSLNPKEKEPLQMLCQIYNQREDWINAERYMSKLFILDKNNERLSWNLANISMKNKNLDRAAYYYGNVVRLNPKSVDAYNKIGDCYMSQGKFEQAYQNYETALTKAGENRDFLTNAGTCANEIKIYGKAIEYLTKSVSLDAANYNTYFQLGKAYEGLSKKKLAKRNYKTASLMQKAQQQSAEPVPAAYTKKM
jgi:tetratricopeptide (TPR) repeat protein